jgi:DNA endonuclease
MRTRFNVVMDYTQVVDWTEKGISPFGRVYRLEAVPSPELAYVCGVRLGDGSQSKRNWQHSYKIRLLVIDREFAVEFSKCASVVLNCRPFRVWWCSRRRTWCTEVSSIMLYKFLKEGLSRFKVFVQHCSDCAAAFLQGFFDSEAGVSDTGLTISNGRLEVLAFVRDLLKNFFGIETSKPSPSGPPPGTRKVIKG